jgi:hypothetical protein
MRPIELVGNLEELKGKAEENGRPTGERSGLEAKATQKRWPYSGKKFRAKLSASAVGNTPGADGTLAASAIEASERVLPHVLGSFVS